jgi:hypothetical protein
MARVAAKSSTRRERRLRDTMKLFVGTGIVVAMLLATESIVYGHKGPWISFYGQVVDQTGRPVAGFKVHLEVVQRTSPVTQYDLGSRVDVLPLTATTGPDGRFEIRWTRGVEVRVRFYDADRYLLNDSRCARGPFFYDLKYLQDSSAAAAMQPIHQPDPARPAVFVVDSN